MITNVEKLESREVAMKLTPKGREILRNSTQVRTDKNTITLMKKQND